MERSMFEWFSPVGGNWAFWAKNKKFMAELIRTYGLKPARFAEVGAEAESKSTPAIISSAVSTHMDLGIHGGIRIPHLHMDDQIYMLDSKQWEELSQRIVADFRTALANAKHIEFEQAIVLGSMTASLAQR